MLLLSLLLHIKKKKTVKMHSCLMQRSIVMCGKLLYGCLCGSESPATIDRASWPREYPLCSLSHSKIKKNKKRQRFRVTNLASWLLCALLSGGLNLGKKISVPKDVMMEELNLSSNRGSRMFLERQKRAERFTMENVANDVDNTSSVRIELRESPKPPRKVPLSHQGSF